jgi:hypothetical protein
LGNREGDIDATRTVRGANQMDINDEESRASPVTDTVYDEFFGLPPLDFVDAQAVAFSSRTLITVKQAKK